MSIFITLGTYSNEGAGGLVEGDSNRRAAMETFHSSFDAKLMTQLQCGHNAIVRQPTICKNWWNK